MKQDKVIDVWLLSLIAANNKIDAICMNLALTLGVSPLRYNELGETINRMLESSSGPRDFWESVNSRRKEMFLNDIESVVFGALLCNILIKLPNPVLYGRTLAKFNNMDYEKIMETFGKEMGECPGRMAGEKGQ